MKTFLKLFFIIIILPLALYEGYYQYSQFKKNNIKGENKSSTTNIRYVDRGYYWNYPYNEKFISYNEDGEEIVINTDALGFRNSEVNKEYDILLLGDSFTSAANTKQELTFANLLNTAGMTVYNAGIDGTGTIHQAHILDDVLKKVKPKLIILNFYLGNDYRDNFYCPDIQSVNIENINTVENTNANVNANANAEAEVNAAANTNTNANVANASDVPKKDEQPKKSTSATAPFSVAMKAKLHNLMEHSGILKLFYNRIYLPAKYQGTDMSYYDRGELMIMAHNKEKPHPDTVKAIQKTEDALIYIKKTLETKNIPLLVVGIPSKAQVLKSVREISNFDVDKEGPAFFSTVKKDVDFDKPDRILAMMCAEQHIPYVSLLQPFRQQYDKKLYYYFDAHWNYIGQEAAANAVLPHAKELLKAPLKTPLFAGSEKLFSEIEAQFTGSGTDSETETQ